MRTTLSNRPRQGEKLTTRRAISRGAQALTMAAAALLLSPACTQAQDNAPEKSSGDSGAVATITVKNTADVALKDVFFKTHDEALLALLNKPGQEYHITRDGKAIATQARDEDNDGKAEMIFMVQDFGAGESADFKVETGPAPAGTNVKRTQAQISVAEGGEWKLEKQTGGTDKHVYHGGKFKEIQEWDVPPEHTDHSFDIRMEGPIWESDLVAYRIYEDWRNAVDMTGKKTHDLVLQNAGQNDFEEYHHPADWGMDVLKVGDSLGLGSVAWWDGKAAQRVAKTDHLSCKISIDGDLCSEVKMRYDGWQAGDTKTDLDGKLTIHAGSRLTRYSLTLSKELDNLCTGIVKMPNTEMIAPPETKSGWTWLATWGKQSLFEPAPDELGLAIFYRAEDLSSLTEDPLSHVVVLKPTDKKLTYFLAGAWIQEGGGDGVKTKEEFKKFLEDSVASLNSPPDVTVALKN